MIIFAGGLAVMLLGVRLISLAAEQSGGKWVRRIFAKRSPAECALIGTVVTTVTQSSSAVTTVAAMMAGAGSMTVAQAFGIIIGSNIGTTSTAWLFAAADISGTVTACVSLVAAIGAIILLCSHKTAARSIGLILSGTLLFLNGAGQMSGAMKAVSISLLTGEAVQALLSGALLTALVQSSSAGVCMLQALCDSAQISVKTAAFIIAGINIGTCSTAVIATVAENLRAKSVAGLHLLFNIAVAPILCSAACVICPDIQVGPFEVAAIHTMSNIIGAAVFFPILLLHRKLHCFTHKCPVNFRNHNSTT